MSNINIANENKSPAVLIADSANVIAVIANQPAIIQVAQLPASTTVEIQARIHVNANWKTLKVLTDADAEHTEVLAADYNFVQVVRTVGVGEFVAYAQY